MGYISGKHNIYLPPNLLATFQIVLMGLEGGGDWGDGEGG